MLWRGDGELKDSRAATRAAGREDAPHERWGVGELAGERKIRLRGDLPYDRICVNLCVNNIWKIGWEVGFRVVESVGEIGSTH